MSKDEKNEFSPKVKGFIDRYIDSVEKLEILLLLYAERNNSWTLPQIAKHLRTSEHSASRRLTELVALGLINRSETEVKSFKFAADEETALVIEELANYYKTKRLRIIELIFSKPIEKLRVFADAFKIRKDPQE